MIQTDNLSIEKFQTVIADLENSSNKEIVQALDFLKNDFEETKTMLMDLSNHLDNIENLYNSVLKEYVKRNNG
jgi:hypothetical protein